MSFIFFFNDTATTEIYTLSLHDALPICRQSGRLQSDVAPVIQDAVNDVLDVQRLTGRVSRVRSEEHTSELQSRLHLVCRLLLEKKKKRQIATQPVFSSGAPDCRATTNTC